MSYIVPRDTPKTCSGCIFSRWSQIYEGKYWCVLNESDEAIYVDLHQKSFNCPLIEITTPHGRLIDADKFKADYSMKDDCAECEKELRYSSRSCEYDRIYSKMDFCGWLDDAEVVIEAEGSET